MNLYIPEYQRYADNRYRDAFETKEPINCVDCINIILSIKSVKKAQLNLSVLQ